MPDLPAAADAAPARARSSRRLAAALVLLEAAPALAGAVTYLLELVTGNATVPRNVVMLVLLLSLLGVGLLLVSRGLLHGRRWARSPAVTWQLLLLAVAWYIGSAGHVLVGALVAAVAVATVVAAFRSTPVSS